MQILVQVFLQISLKKYHLTLEEDSSDLLH